MKKLFLVLLGLALLANTSSVSAQMSKVDVIVGGNFSTEYTDAGLYGPAAVFVKVGGKIDDIHHGRGAMLGHLNLNLGDRRKAAGLELGLRWPIEYGRLGFGLAVSAEANDEEYDSKDALFLAQVASFVVEHQVGLTAEFGIGYRDLILRHQVRALPGEEEDWKYEKSPGLMFAIKIGWNFGGLIFGAGY